MGRSESTAVANQGMAQSATNQANATTALGQTNDAVSKYNKQLQDYLNFGNQEFSPNGEMMRTSNTLANTNAQAGARATEGDLALNRLRTGANTANFAPTVAAGRRQGSLDQTNFMAQQNAARIAALAKVQETGLSASQFPAQAYGNIYGTSVGGAASNLSPAASASQVPGFWDTFAPALAAGAGTAIAGACCCAGSMIRMADETEKPIEKVKKGDFLWSFGHFNPANQVLEDPKSIIQPCTEIESGTGRKHRASDSHTLMLTAGGYKPMPEMADNSALTEQGTEFVLVAKNIGEQLVYPLKINGNRTYMADGFWILA